MTYRALAFPLVLLGVLAPLASPAQTQLWSMPATQAAPPPASATGRVVGAGEPVMASSSGGWHRATVLEAGPAGYKVRYEGWGSGWDEWLPAARLRLPDGGAVAPPAVAVAPVAGGQPRPADTPAPLPAPAQRPAAAPTPAAPAPAPASAAGDYRAGEQVWVTWTGTSHRARILQARGGQYLVRYDGFDSSWDEWVGSGRIRGRVEGAAAQRPAGQAQGTAARPGTQATQGRAGSRSPVGPWECVTWDAGQLNRIGGFTLAANGTYTDLNSRQSGRYTYQEAGGRIAFTSGPQRVNAPITFNPDGRQGLGHIVFDYGGGAKLDCYRASR